MERKDFFLKSLEFDLMKQHEVGRYGAQNLPLDLKLSIKRTAKIEDSPATPKTHDTEAFCAFCPRRANKKKKKRFATFAANQYVQIYMC